MKIPPICSIVVPTHSRPRQLGECLEALAGLDYPRDRYEVIVVDDGSEPPLEGLASRFEGRLRLTLLRQACAGPAAARNAGVAVAGGEVLAFTDDDCRPERDWLRVMASHLAVHPDCLAGGRTINALAEESYSVASQTIIDTVYGYYNANPTEARFFASNNIAATAERFRTVGGFDPSFRTSEDRDLCDRWLRARGRMAYLAEARVLHAHHLAFRDFLKQHFSYGRGAFRFLEARKGRGDRDFNHSSAFYRRLLRSPFEKEVGWKSVRVAFLLAVSQVASLAGFAIERVQSRRDAVPPAAPAVVVERTSDAPSAQVVTAGSPQGTEVAGSR